MYVHQPTTYDKAIEKDMGYEFDGIINLYHPNIKKRVGYV